MVEISQFISVVSADLTPGHSGRATRVRSEFVGTQVWVTEERTAGRERVGGKNMRLVSTAHRDQQVLHHSRALWEATNHLRELAHRLREDGLDDEANSLETSIRDLGWQYEALINKELLGEWPAGPRRAMAGQLRAVR